MVSLACSSYLFILVCAGLTGVVRSVGNGLCWTNWINKYRAAEGVDDELLSSTDAYIYGVCPKPLAVDVARIDGLPVKEKLNCEFFGCLCRDINQRPGVKCGDYKVRFLCLCHDIHQKKERKIQSALLCHGSSGRSFQCPKDKVLSVKSAYYGTIWLSQCGAGLLNSFCRKESSDMLDTVRQICDGKKSCTVPGPPSNYDGPNCGPIQKHLHLEITCAEPCRRNGKTYYTGNQFVDALCKVRCTCVSGGRFVCIPLCPVKYGVVCPNKGVVRLRRKLVSSSPKCSCLIPTCFNSKIKGCTIDSKSYAAGQKFHRNCKQECQCMGQGRISCQPLCGPDSIKCDENQVVEYEERATQYKGCTCKEAVCK